MISIGNTAQPLCVRCASRGLCGVAYIIIRNGYQEKKAKLTAKTQNLTADFFKNFCRYDLKCREDPEK